MMMSSSVPSELSESTDADGNWREAWSPVLGALSQYDEAQINSCQHEIQRRFRENGLAYGITGRRKAYQRPWHLDLMPQMMGGDDWNVLESGLQQRARLKATLLKDLYGEQRVLHEGIVPVNAVFAHKGFTESAVGVPAFEHLPLYCADVSRSPSGAWYVVDDICQTPNGVGHALENRLILSGVLSNLYRNSRIRRVAEYFKHVREALFQNVDSNARCVVLGYGAEHHYHFEQAYLAKYLGYTLVQINDLTVRGKYVWLKTVDGLQRVGVIFRFVDDDDIDPLAGDSNNISGVPGLLHAAREGGVEVVNPIGAAAIENPAFNAWLPELCEFLLNEKIELLGAPTYWLGDTDHLQRVESRFNELLFRSIDTQSELQDPASMGEQELSQLQTQIAQRPERFIAQERIGRSSSPTLVNDHVEQQQLTMRMFLVNDAESYRAMPGGLGFLDSHVGGGRPKIRNIASSKDVWVVSDKTVPHVTLLNKRPAAGNFRVVEGELPSSVAESLFWLGRYSERIENSARVLLGVLLHLRSDERFENDESAQASLAALLKSTTEVTGTSPGFVGNGGSKKISAPTKELFSLLSDTDRIGTLPNCLDNLSYSAAMVRDRLSGDMYRVLSLLDDHQSTLESLQQEQTPVDREAFTGAIDALNNLLTTLAAFSGLTRENMTQGAGWRFHEIGKRVERASQTSEIIATVFSEYYENSFVLEDLLNVLCSAMTYRSRYRTLLEPRLVFQLLVVDETNPRSLGYQLTQLEKQIQLLPGHRAGDHQEPALRAALEGLARIRLIKHETLFEESEEHTQNKDIFFAAMKEVPIDITTAMSAQYFTHTELPDVLYSGFDNGSEDSASESIN